MQQRLVTAHADLNPDRRLQGSGGQARSLYAELVKNLSTRSKPDGGALNGVVEKFVVQAKTDSKAQGVPLEDLIRKRLSPLTEMVGGYDFAEVIAAYCRGFEEGNDQLKADAVRWLRGEFTTKTEARAAMGVRNIIDDDLMYDYLKLFARFVRLTGFGGLLVCLDELVNLYKLANRQARDNNYEQILRILNDVLQGTTEGIGFLLGGTPEFLLDSRRGLYSYPALQSRLAENTFAVQAGVADYSGPVLRLTSLTPEDFYVLLQKLRHVYAYGDAAKYLLPDEGIHAYMAHTAKRLGEAYFRTPRTTITAFLGLLAVLEQHSSTDWRQLLGAVQVETDTGGSLERAVDSDELATFKL
jgi:bacteriophage exclusion system BrxC/D-like protein